VFIVFGAGKFRQPCERAGVVSPLRPPSTEVFVDLIGALEVVGGLMLAAGLWVRLVALLLAGDMVGAIVVSGIGRGELVSLTLAPVLLLAMLYLVLDGGR